MNLIIGRLIVFACVLGGFAVHGGHLGALWQPSELLIIGGAAAMMGLERVIEEPAKKRRLQEAAADPQ